MKQYFKFVFIPVVFALLAIAAVQADIDKKMVVAVKADDFELAETDISSLEAGESQTIETESGKVIDILRTEDGVEIYVDGELLEVDFTHAGLHEEHRVEKHVEVICDSDETCDEDVIVMAGDSELDFEALAGEAGQKIIIHKNAEFACADDEDDAGCGHKMAWFSDSEADDIDLEKVHKMHRDGDDPKVIVVRKKIIVDD